ncbi:MAG: hypothetical protein ABSD85_15825 [Acidimicrobiales bacterium]
MRKLGIASPSVLLAAGVISSLPLLASLTSTIGVSPRTTSPIGKLLAELKGSDTVAGNAFGVSVAISGAIATVGAPGYAKNAGRAYVFGKMGTGWKQTAELKGSDTVAGDYFGYTAAISGTIAVVSAPGYAKDAGRVYVFAETTTGWKQAAELKGFDTVAGDYFGDSVAISGTTVVVGAPGYAKNAGRVYVFAETTTGWKQAAELKGSDTVADDGFGYTVAISGTTAIAGTPDHAKDAGRAYVFGKMGAGWMQTAELKGSDTVAGDYFGYTAAISGTISVVGAPGYAKDAGRVYVFTNTATGWKQAAELKGFDTVADDGFGGSVAISGTAAVVGAGGHAKSAGRVYVFKA